MPCPFLGGDNLCSIYDVRPKKLCREFPHTDRKKIYQINHLTIKNTLTLPSGLFIFVEKIERSFVMAYKFLLLILDHTLLDFLESAEETALTQMLGKT